jgi:CHAT domain-containing protein
VRLFGGVLPPLPGTEREVRAIGNLFTSTQSRAAVLIGTDATAPKLSEAIAARPPRYLHLATHGLMGSAERPYDAALALTQPQEPTPEDIGFLRLEDLLSRWGGKLNDCDLVVLSACDTQRGQRQGDTVMSLPLGFFFAGARTVVASLWKVDDTATALLMVRFYENLLGTGSQSAPLPKAEALREAKQWLRGLSWEETRGLCAAHQLALPDGQDRGEPGTIKAEDVGSDGSSPPAQHPYEHPYYWSAFILVGDPN